MRKSREGDALGYYAVIGGGVWMQYGYGNLLFVAGVLMQEVLTSHLP